MSRSACDVENFNSFSYSKLIDIANKTLLKYVHSYKFTYINYLNNKINVTGFKKTRLPHTLFSNFNAMYITFSVSIHVLMI